MVTLTPSEPETIRVSPGEWLCNWFSCLRVHHPSPTPQTHTFWETCSQLDDWKVSCTKSNYEPIAYLAWEGGVSAYRVYPESVLKTIFGGCDKRRHSRRYIA